MLRRAALFLLLPAIAACGPALDATVTGGSVTIEGRDEVRAGVRGTFAFERRVRVTADHEGASLRVDCDGSISPAAASLRHPGPGIVELVLDDGARMHRRDDFAFDLTEGSARVRSGPVPARLIVINGRCHVSAESGDNPQGIDVRVAARGDQLRVEVLRGRVLLNATDEEERDTVFVTLEAGDCGVAKTGEEPRKGTTGWFE